MRFYSDVPDLHIIRQRAVGNRIDHFELCVFDENGEVETEDKEIIRQLINIYRHDEVGTKKVEKVKIEKIKTFECKKCGEKVDNAGLLMAHYKTIHPKPKKK